MSLVKEFLQTPNVWIGVGEKIKIRNKKWCSINTTQPSKGKQNYQCSLFCTNTKLLFSPVEKKLFKFPFALHMCVSHEEFVQTNSAFAMI